MRQGGFGIGLRPAGIARAGENTLEEDEHRRVVIEEQHFVSVVHEQTRSGLAAHPIRGVAQRGVTQSELSDVRWLESCHRRRAKIDV